LTLVINESSTLVVRFQSCVGGSVSKKQDANLDVRLGLIGDLHQEFGPSVDHMIEDPLIDTEREAKVRAVPVRWPISHLHSTEVIRVGNEQILLPIGNQLIQDTRVQKGVVKISVTRGVPVLLVVVGTMGAREKSLLEDTWVPRLVEGGDAKLLVGILLDDSDGIFVGVERSHEDHGNVHLISGVQMLDLADGQVKESHLILDLQSALRASHSYFRRAHGIRTTKRVDAKDKHTNP